MNSAAQRWNRPTRSEYYSSVNSDGKVSTMFWVSIGAPFISGGDFPNRLRECIGGVF